MRCLASLIPIGFFPVRSRFLIGKDPISFTLGAYLLDPRKASPSAEVISFLMKALVVFGFYQKVEIILFANNPQDVTFLKKTGRGNRREVFLTFF